MTRRLRRGEWRKKAGGAFAHPAMGRIPLIFLLRAMPATKKSGKGCRLSAPSGAEGGGGPNQPQNRPVPVA